MEGPERLPALCCRLNRSLNWLHDRLSPPVNRRTNGGFHLSLAGVLLLTAVTTATASSATVQIGHPAPSVQLPVLRNAETPLLSLSALRGKVIYLDFWASWCGPCRISFPLLEELREEFHPMGFEVLAINLDEFEQDAVEFIERHPVGYPVIRDASGDLARRYGILGMPTGFLLDRHGVVRHVHQGFRRSDIEFLRKHVVELLEEPR